MLFLPPHNTREQQDEPDHRVTGRRVFLREACLAAAAVCLALHDDKTAAAQAPKVKMTKLPDGSGTVGLPPGWKVDGSYAGTCRCTGPTGGEVLMGMRWPIQRPDFDMSEFPNQPLMPTAPVGNLAAALRAVIEVEGKGKVNSIHVKQAQGPAGKPAATFVYEFVQNGKTKIGMGYFTMLDYLPGLPNWNLYSSTVLAPKERFVEYLPAMLAIYDSWRPDGKVPKEAESKKMADAVAAELRRQGAATIKSRQETFERMLQKWREVQ